jgi:ABC-type branched-subunit amino acid transport system ATPase component/sugar phosphate permease
VTAPVKPHGADDLLLDEIVGTKEELREQARIKLGVTGDVDTRGLRQLAHEHGLSVYPVVALGLLSIADTFQAEAFTILTPELAGALGISAGAIAASRALAGLAAAVAPLPMAALAQHRARRALLCIVTGIGWSVLTLYTGVVTSAIGMLLVLTLDGLTTGSVSALHGPLLIDSYHPETRVRVFSVYAAFGRLGAIVSPLLVGLLAGLLGFTWRCVFIGLGLTSILMSLVSLRLKDPGFGKWDTEQLRESVHEHHGEPVEPLRDEDVALGFWEICRRLMLIPTNRRVFAATMVFGALSVPLGTFISFFLDKKWDLGPGERSLFFSYQATIAVIALLVYGTRGEKQFRKSPKKVLQFAGMMLGAGIVLIAAGGLSPYFIPMLVLFGLASCCLGVLGPALGIALLSIVPANMRPHASGISGIFAGIGGLMGALFFAGVDSRYGEVGTMISVVVPGVVGAIMFASGGRYIEDDLDRMIDDVLEDEEIKRIHASGGRLPMLACRGIDFSYGQLQVLFDVDFTVDDGEMVALLGTNGAGKSTLLKVVSGIGLPSGGTVRFRGQEITFMAADRRTRLGITQVPGGRAVFGSMSVVDNLRTFGFTLGRDRKALDLAIERSFDAFPRLAERRNSLAATLSGGEQQMLGLSRALIMQPRLLVIDELSLGLAPVIVGQLLDMVRLINAEGTAVVLVEQSVNIALNLVEHAYFMEKGEMRFDGRSTDLLARGDLLRAVFLQGADAADGAP